MSNRRRQTSFLLAPEGSRKYPLVEASHPLDAREQRVLAEAIRRGERAGREVESQLVELGRWILDNVFEGDASAALTRRRTNRVWHELTQRAGSPSLRLSERLLHVALSIAAHDERIKDAPWRELEPGRKELLLPLADPRAMRDAARRVVEMKLSQRATRDLVRRMRQERGKAPTVRTSPTALATGLRRISDRLSDLESTHALEGLARRLDDEQRKTLLQEIAALEALLQTVARAVKT